MWGVAEEQGGGNEVPLCAQACQPGLRKLRGDGGFAAVLGVVRQDATLGDGAEAMSVLPGRMDVVRIKCEERVLGRVGAGPIEGLYPGIRLTGVGYLDVS